MYVSSRYTPWVSLVGFVLLITFSASTSGAKVPDFSAPDDVDKSTRIDTAPVTNKKTIPAPKPKGITLQPLKRQAALGYCCIEGELSKSDQKICISKHGRFSDNAASAKRECARMRGWCCVKGELEQTSVAVCDSRNGKINFDRSQAVRQCGLVQGYCCKDGNLARLTKTACGKQSGLFETDKTKAKNQCDRQLVYCCLDGELKKTSVDSCRQKRLPVYKNMLMARDKCRPAGGFCCTGGEILRIGRDKCLSRTGSFFSLESQAIARCATARKMTIKMAVPKTGQVESPSAMTPRKKESATIPLVKAPVKASVFGSSARKMRKDSGSEDPADDPVGGPVGGPIPEVSVDRPVAGILAITGDSLIVRYTIDEPSPPTVRVDLQRHDGGVVTHTYTLYEGLPQSGDRTLSLPLAVPGEDYRVKVTTIGEAVSREGESGSFAVSGTFERNLVFATEPYWRIVPGAGEIGELSYGVNCEGRDCEGMPAFNAQLSIAGSVSDMHSFIADSGNTYTSSVLVGNEHVCGAEVTLVLDPENAVAETSETDNTWTRTATCIDAPAEEMPDLVVQSVGVSPHIVAEGDTVSFRYRLINTERFGSVATGSFRVGLRVDGSVRDTQRHRGGLAPGERADGELSWDADCDASFEIVVDIEEDVAEADEANNEYPKDRTLFRCGEETLDLRVENFSARDRSTTLAGSAGGYNADIVAYSGNPGSVRVRCGIDGGATLYDDILSLADISAATGRPVRWANISFVAVLCPADTMFRMYCEVDPDNHIVESDESNNRQQYDIHTYMEEPWDYCASLPGS